MTRRKRCSAQVEARVALEAIREEPTTAEPAKKCGIRPTMTGGCKTAASENMASAVGGKSTEARPIFAGEVEKPRAKIGQRVVERDFLADASSPILGTGGRKR